MRRTHCASVPSPDPGAEVLDRLAGWSTVWTRRDGQLAGANLDLVVPEEPMQRLWQLCTTLRRAPG